VRRIALLATMAAGCSLVLDGDRFQDDRFDAGAAGESGGSLPGREVDAGLEVPGADAGGTGEDPEEQVCREVCLGGDCKLTCPDGDCACQLDCGATDGTCKPDCDAVDCSIDCRGVNNCEPRCRHGSSCEIDCAGANDCDEIRCESEASCLVWCAGANNCEFDRCSGPEQRCPGDVIVCNRPCP
jgi:hypothetical protein